MTADWSFEDMGEIFDTHVAAHLPGYADVQKLIALAATYLVSPGGTVADLGASTGRAIAEISEAIPAREFTAHLYDSDGSMLTQAAQRLESQPNVTPAFHQMDLNPRRGFTLEHGDADLTLMMWLLQFLPPAARRPLMIAARSRSAPSGALIISAKTRLADPRWQELADAALDDYKAAAGVSPTERVAKTKALRGTMKPDTDAQVIQDLTATGWHSPVVLWRWHVWTVFGAYATPLGTASYR